MTKVEMTGLQMKLVKHLLERERDCVVALAKANDSGAHGYSHWANINRKRVKDINVLIASMVLDFVEQGGNPRTLANE